ncbi:MAG TPA: adenylate/guanylate cyclase domain-containing protein [Leptospiraceae bacterium]|nr:adenylate/guanylate cyclase domain-containing protein [Leptospiraceae bacterium]HRG75761.1 adenylate/guanylate cyclase domain-containing protein [Leptospiraceae bacterium]
MKKRYYLSMLGLFPIIIIFDSIYFIYHQSLTIFLGLGFVHFILYVLMNYLGAYFIYKPIEQLFLDGIETMQATKRINRITLYSTVWIFLIGNVYILISLMPLYFFPTIFKSPDDFVIEKIPPEFFFYSILPAIYFIYALFPAFLAYFIINDFKLDLKEKVFTDYNIRYADGKKKIGITLFFVFLFLVVLPSLLVILELKMAFELEHKYAQFTKLSPLQTVLIDRFVLFIGTVIAVILITRSFTKPINSLLKVIGRVREGDFGTQAAITTEDEIGVLTKEFNEMVNGLKERELIRDTFGKYVTKDIATVILEKKINVEGEVRSCTILVTDIANYTTISEELSPKEIVQMLNEYFSVLVNIIQSHKGIVNKFIGDSIFAMFNVPLDDPDHAVNAILAALEIENVTANRKFGKNRQLSTRIGINTGVIVAGNIGSAERMEYTVIGDEVNIASRLEQLNKEHGTHILLGENTYELAKDHFRFARLGDFQLKGKEKSIKVYKVEEGRV